jgi:hypothetical protein
MSTSTKIAVTAAVALRMPILLVVTGVGAVTIILAGAGSASAPSQAALVDIPADYLTSTRKPRKPAQGLTGPSSPPSARSNPITAGSTHPAFAMARITWEPVVPCSSCKPRSTASSPAIPSRTAEQPRRRATTLMMPSMPPRHTSATSGARNGKDLHAAIFAYNHADWYVQKVLNQAKIYASATAGNGDCNTIQAPNAATLTAINYACGYEDCPTSGAATAPS